MVRGYTLQQFISIFEDCNKADRVVERYITAEFGPQVSRGGCGQCCDSCLLKVGTLPILIIPNLTRLEVGKSSLITSSCGGARMRL